MNASSDVYNLVGKAFGADGHHNRFGRVVSMTAQLKKDWGWFANTDISTDDFGQATDPIVINCAKAKEGFSATDIGLYDVLTTLI